MTESTGPFEVSEFFDPERDARADIAEALAAARTDGRDVLLVFGAGWCADCVAFVEWWGDPAVAAELARFSVVPVTVGVERGQRDLNAEVDRDYNHPIEGGIPAVSILSPEGKIRYDSAEGEFSRARHMAPADFVTFLREEH